MGRDLLGSLGQGGFGIALYSTLAKPCPALLGCSLLPSHPHMGLFCARQAGTRQDGVALCPPSPLSGPSPEFHLHLSLPLAEQTSPERRGGAGPQRLRWASFLGTGAPTGRSTVWVRAQGRQGMDGWPIRAESSASGQSHPQGLFCKPLCIMPPALLSKHRCGPAGHIKSGGDVRH